MKNVNQEREKEEVDESAYMSGYREGYLKYQQALAAEKQKEKDYREGKTTEKPVSVRNEEIKQDIKDKIRIKKQRDKTIQQIKPKTLEELRKVNPDITEEGYALYLKASRENLALLDPELLISVEKAQKVYNDKTDVTISRLYSPVLKDTHYNAHLLPADKQAEEDHAWNTKFVQAVEHKDQDTMDRMALERLPKIFEEAGLEIPEVEKLEEFAEDTLKNHYTEYVLVAQRNLGISNLEKYSPAVKNYLKEHPDFNALTDVYAALSNYIEYYIQAKYGLDLHNGAPDAKAVTQGAAEAMKYSMEMMKENYKVALEKYRGITS